MSDSVKLRFEHGIWCMIFSHLALAASIAFCFLGHIVDTGFALLAFLGFMATIFLFISAISYFREAAKISFTEGKKQED